MKAKTIKRIGVWLLIMTILSTFISVPVQGADLTFKDVKKSDWFYTYVMNLVKQNIVGGYPNGTFRPNNHIERQHVCKMIVLAADIPYRGKEANFPDVPKDSDMSPYIGALQELGIITGYPDGTFRPKETLNRAELCKMISIAFDLKSSDITIAWNDIKGHWAEKDILILGSNGIVKGYGDGTFRPGKTITRAEVAKILNIAFVVKAVEYAEMKKTQKATYAAEAWVDALPNDQDIVTKNALLRRINLLKIPTKDNAWFSKSMEAWGAKITIYYNDVVKNVNPATGSVVTRIVPFYLVVVCIHEINDDLWFSDDCVMMVDSKNKRWEYSTLSNKTVPLGTLPQLSEYKDQLGWVSEGYLFYMISPSSVPTSIGYWHWVTDMLECKITLPEWK